MAKNKLSRDGEDAIRGVLADLDLTRAIADDFVARCAKIIHDFKPRHRTNINRRREALLAWCDQSATSIRKLRSLLVDRPPTVRLALRRNLTPIVRQLPQVERQLRRFAKAAKDQTPSNRPPGTIKDDLAEQVGSWLLRLGVPVVTSPDGTFIAITEILWTEISGSEDANLYKPATRALASLKKNHPTRFPKRRSS